MVSLRNDFKIPHGIPIVKQEREIICKKASGSYQTESVTSEMDALRPGVAALLGKLAYARKFYLTAGRESKSLKLYFFPPQMRQNAGSNRPEKI